MKMSDSYLDLRELTEEQKHTMSRKVNSPYLKQFLKFTKLKQKQEVSI